MSYNDSTSFGEERGKSDVAKDHAADLKDHAVGAGQDLGGQAKVEAKGVARDAKQEARGLLDSVMSESRGQVRNGQSRLAEGVRTLAQEMGEMAGGSQQNGQAAQIARTLSSRGDDVAQWLETHEPDDVVDSVRRYASRNPVTFLAIAAGAGLLVGRFARGFQAVQSDDNDYRGGRGFADRGYGYDGGYQGQGYAAQRPTYADQSYAQEPYAQQSYTQQSYAQQSYGQQGQTAGYQAETGAQGQAWHQQADSAYGERGLGEGR